MNLGDIKRRVLTQMGDSNNALITAAAVVDWANDGQLDIARKTKCLEDSVDIPVVNGTDRYDKPADLMLIGSAELDGYLITATTREDVNSLDPSRSANATEGTPTVVYPYGDSVYLYPIPTSDGTLRLFYIRTPEPLVADGDVPEIPVQMHEDIVRYALANAKELNEEEDIAQSIRAEYSLRISLSTEEAQNPNDESYPAVRLIYGD